MRVSANVRIQWLHGELTRNTYPNAARLAERFHISRRQAQRDIDFLKKQLGAPMEYDGRVMGYRYTTPFTLPVSVTNENDGGISRAPMNPFGRDAVGDSIEADSVIIQGQIPYTATLGITDKLTVLEMRSYIISEEARGQFLCEFHNIDRFLCAILTARSGIRIIEPSWLREKLLHMARKAIDKVCADVEIQSGNKAYWFKVDEQGEIAGGIAKFAAPLKEQLTAKLGLTPGCFVGVTAGKKLAAQKTAGVIRKLVGTRVPGHFDEEQYAMCWIVDFPMYEMGEESGQLEFCHNPFSMPQGGMQALLDAEGDIEKLLAINADQYDLVVNGYESASGAVRNHDPEIMVKAFQMVGLGEEDVKAKFPAMYNAFTYGAPPHAGAAPGVDRLIMLLTGEESIREVITFPMNKNAQDLMMDAPTTVSQKQLDDVHILINESHLQ